MAVSAVGAGRRRMIADAISSELDRQARAGAVRIDVEALATAVDRAVSRLRPSLPGRVQMRLARRPDQLNATNDG